jgi:hypothetical protein
MSDRLSSRRDDDDDESRDENLPHILSLKSKLNTKSRPKTADNFDHQGEKKRSSSPTASPSPYQKNNSQQAWGNNSRITPSHFICGTKSKKGKKMKSSSQIQIQTHTRSSPEVAIESDWNTHGGKELLKSLPIHTSIPICLHQIIDTFVRRILPWQVSPRSTLHIRQSSITRTHSSY